MSAAQPFEGPTTTTEASKIAETDALPAALPDGRGNLVELTKRTVDQVGLLSGRLGVPLMRIGLGLVYIWFGALKVTGKSEVFNLVAVTLPFVNPHVFVPILGVIEVLLGVGLCSGRVPRLVLLAVLGHLAGTFLTFITAPSWMWRGGNPLLLTTDGEFVLKNIILISAVLVLLGVTSKIRAGSAEARVMRRLDASQ
jgi:uncharacterized membrane protein YkgB